MSTDQAAQEGVSEVIDQLKDLRTILRRGTQRKAIRTLLKGLEVMLKAIPPESYDASHVGVLLAFLVFLQEQISDIEERIFAMEGQLAMLLEQIEVSTSSRRRI